jgi:Chain length determinant protein
MADSKIQPTLKDKENSISLKEFIVNFRDGCKYLFSKWKLLLIAAVIGGSIGLIYSLIKKPVYTATVTFALEDQSGGGTLSSYAGIASQFGINLGATSSGAFSGDNIMQLMQSRLMITKALLSPVEIDGKTESLADYYIAFKHFRKLWANNYDLYNITFPSDADINSLTFIQDSIIGVFYNRIFKENLTVDKVDKDLDIYEVDCKSKNELFAKYFADNLVKNTTDFYITTTTEQASDNVNILQDRLDSVRKAYSAALYGTADETDQNLNPSRSVVAVPQLQGQTNVEILAAELGELTKNLEIAKLTLLQQTPLIQVIDTPILPLQMNKIGKLMGLFIGGFLAIFIISISLLLTRLLKNILSKS